MTRHRAADQNGGTRGRLRVLQEHARHSPARFFRFPLMVIYPESDTAPRRSSMTWSALKAERLILQAPPSPLRELIDDHLEQAGVDARSATEVNHLDTLIALVEAGEGAGIVSAVYVARLSVQKRSHDPPRQSRRAGGLLSDSRPRPEAVRSRRRILHIPAGLHRALGRTCRRSINR